MLRRGCAAVGAVALVGLLGAAAPAGAADRVIAVEGVSKQAADVRVEILVEVPAGNSASKAADRALEAQGAKRAPEQPQSAAFTFNGLYWDSLRTVQSYNPSGQPTTRAQTALTNTYSTWNAASRWRISSGGTTNRCPSLVQECAGPQRFDGRNDVGWARLGGSTLGVTWYGTSIDEADMAISNRYAWSTTCAPMAGAYDLQTVFLHENGHVAGLGHSSDRNAVMYPSYQTARCTLGTDDRNGIATLYR
jgi:hypothetical protein